MRRQVLNRKSRHCCSRENQQERIRIRFHTVVTSHSRLTIDKIVLGQWFSSFNCHQDSLKGLKSQTAGSHPRASDSAGQGWGPHVYVKKVPEGKLMLPWSRVHTLLRTTVLRNHFSKLPYSEMMRGSCPVTYKETTEEFFQPRFDQNQLI